MSQGNLLLAMYEVGDRVEVGTHTDAWMRGERYGEIVSIGRFYLHIKMDASGRTLKFVPENVKGKA